MMTVTADDENVADLLRKSGYGMIICDSNNVKDVEEQNIKFLVEKKVDGILVVPVSTDDGFLDVAKRADIPVVTLDRSISGAQLDCVTIDNVAASQSAVEYLIERGHKRIAPKSIPANTGATDTAEP